MTHEINRVHGHWQDLKTTYDDALARLPDALKKEGFGIVTQVDIQETFKAKLGVDFRRYRIFGACNPALAHRALQGDLQVGVLLPCNVVLYEKDDGTAVVGAVDPMQTLGAGAASRELAELALDVTARLERFVADLAS